MQVKPRKRVLHHADDMVRTWQRELDHTGHTDHTDHTDQEPLPCLADLHHEVGRDHTDHTDHLPIGIMHTGIDINM